jgi:hypothetical protein
MSSTKTLCLRSALLLASDCGVMCSATQCGLRVRRSKEDVREAALRRSATGPGKPYWKTPLGSTGRAGVAATCGMPGTGGIGAGRGGPVVVVVVVVVVDRGVSFFDVVKRAAVAAAPVAAPAAAIKAKVTFDMVEKCVDVRSVQRAR